MHKKMKYSIKDFFSKCDQIRRKLDLVTLIEEILNGKLHFLCSDTYKIELQMEKAPIYDCLRFLKVSSKFRIPTIYNSAIICQ